jgi:hypothetical protein
MLPGLESLLLAPNTESSVSWTPSTTLQIHFARTSTKSSWFTYLIAHCSPYKPVGACQLGCIDALGTE